MIEAKFFEQYPLYRKYEYPRIGKMELQHLPKLLRSIQGDCEKCGCERTFRVSHWRIVTAERGWNQGLTRNAELQGGTFLVEYTCSGCDYCVLQFYVRFLADAVLKVGQTPPWSIEPTAMVKKAVGKYVDLYKKGLTSEAFSYGIGAHAYFRRIVELVIEDLLEAIEELIPDNERALYQAALAKAKEERVAEKKSSWSSTSCRTP